MLSRFLPEPFRPEAGVILLAGRGLYPHLSLRAMRDRGIHVSLIAFEGETDEDLVRSFDEKDRETIKVGQLGHMLKAMERFGAGYALMAGQITPRRLFRGLHPDIKAIAILMSLKERNAESIFGAISDQISRLGIQILDARSFMDDALASAGIMSGSFTKADLESLDYGRRIAKEVARLDIGQGVVVRKGTVLAVEAFEGTDAMLRRAGGFETDHLIFVKTVKPNQDYRFDVPVFGPTTMEVLREARISKAALEAGNTIMLKKAEVLAKAAEWKISLYGY